MISDFESFTSTAITSRAICLAMAVRHHVVVKMTKHAP